MVAARLLSLQETLSVDVIMRSVRVLYRSLFAALLLTLLTVIGVVSAAEPASPKRSAAEAVARFSTGWKSHAGYMRPAEDNGWKVRMEAFQTLVRQGRESVPVLTEALRSLRDDDRVFAAQALALLADSSSRPVLEAALEDPHPAVRLYAIDALSMLRRMQETDRFRALRDDDESRDVRSHMRFALDRDKDPRPQAIQEQLLAYDLSRMGSAHLGEPAPDFTLSDPLGKTYRLSQFRGKQAVVLVFVYGDT